MVVNRSTWNRCAKRTPRYCIQRLQSGSSRWWSPARQLDKQRKTDPFHIADPSETYSADIFHQLENEIGALRYCNHEAGTPASLGAALQ